MAEILLVAALAWMPGRAWAEKPTRPFPDIEHVVIISMDGMRPDRLLLANMPTVRGLIARGAYTFWARTTAMAITLPSHVSMLTAVTPQKHGIYWNSELALKEPIYPAFPTLFEMARRAGYSTAMVAGKAKFNTLDKPGTIEWVSVPPKTVEENEPIVEAADAIIREHRPEVLFIHFAEVDSRGHKFGWA